MGEETGGRVGSGKTGPKDRRSGELSAEYEHGRQRRAPAIGARDREGGTEWLKGGQAGERLESRGSAGVPGGRTRRVGDLDGEKTSGEGGEEGKRRP